MTASGRRRRRPAARGGDGGLRRPIASAVGPPCVAAVHREDAAAARVGGASHAVAPDESGGAGDEDRAVVRVGGGGGDADGESARRGLFSDRDAVQGGADATEGTRRPWPFDGVRARSGEGDRRHGSSKRLGGASRRPARCAPTASSEGRPRAVARTTKKAWT